MSTEQSECTDCDPGIVDCLQCKADGVDAQAKYNDANLPDLRAARTQYDTTRGDYRTARHSVALEVQELRHQAKLLVERVRCLIKQEHVVHRLDEAGQPEPAEAGRFVHVAVGRGYGTELRSCWWLTIGPDTDLDVVTNRRLRHVHEEFAYLAGFLPGLYAAEHGGQADAAEVA